MSDHSDIKKIADQYVKFAFDVIDKLSDDFETDISVTNHELKCIVETMIDLSQKKDVDFTDESEVIYFIQFTEELYSRIFDLSNEERDALLDKTPKIAQKLFNKWKISGTDKERIIKLAPLIKIFLRILLRNQLIQKSRKNKFPQNVYPILQSTQQGGHLYNGTLNIMYLTKQSGGDGEFYNRNYGVNYATTGGDGEFYKRNYGVNYATTGGDGEFYKRNYGVNYATTGGDGEFYKHNYGVNYATTGGDGEFYKHNYGVNYATTGGGPNSPLNHNSKELSGGNAEFYKHNYGVNYATTGGYHSTRSLGTMMDRVPTYYKNNYWS